MGYDESQYNLPRWIDLSVSRQGMFDDTFHFIPSQGWMFLPLVVYHGGGDAAMFEPLIEHIKVIIQTKNVIFVNPDVIHNFVSLIWDEILIIFQLSFLLKRLFCFQEYEWGLAQYMGAGVAACYRGTRVFDSPQTEDVVKKWVTFYKVIFDIG